MPRTALKSCLARFPAPDWRADLGLDEFSEPELIAAIAEVLVEFGKFPVPWSGLGGETGLFVDASNGRCIGHWISSEGTDGAAEAVSTASEDLDNVDTASRVIFQTYFSHALAANSNDENNSSGT
jgi:hypothetical protein